MPTFIAFLRAVNVGKRKYPMAELRDALTAAGFEKVQTHIQTGNVVFRTNLRSSRRSSPPWRRRCSPTVVSRCQSC